MIREVNHKKEKVIVWSIFLFALIIRFLWFKQTTYFGFDEARDAYVSQEIYTKGDWKIIGPPATGNIGLFHGSLYWYLLGPLYLLFGGDHFWMSALFRIINSLGVFLVYGIGTLAFSSSVGLVTAFLYAISFEQSQYAWYASKESLSVLAWLAIVYGIFALLRNAKNKKWMLPLIAGCFAMMVQINMIFAASIIPISVMLLLIWKQLRKQSTISYLYAVAIGLLVSATYIVSEIKFGFRSVGVALKLVSEGFGIMTPGETKQALFWKKYLVMFHDNVAALPLSNLLLISIALGTLAWIAFMAIKKVEFRIILVWILSWTGLMMVGGHMAYYTHAGLSVSILLVLAVWIVNMYKKYSALTVIAVFLVIASNFSLIYAQREDGLLGGIKPQPYMSLKTEKLLIDKMYAKANGRGFTVRLTGIPYKVQTVWAYLFEQYGYEKYGYYPYWENGNAVGFPGYLPPADHGTNCLRFLVREPMRGLPIEIVDEDIKTENLFSKIVLREEIGQFVLEERESTDEVCHDDKPQKVRL